MRGPQPATISRTTDGFATTPGIVFDTDPATCTSGAPGCAPSSRGSERREERIGRGESQRRAAECVRSRRSTLGARRRDGRPAVAAWGERLQVGGGVGHVDLVGAHAAEARRC